MKEKLEKIAPDIKDPEKLQEALIEIISLGMIHGIFINEISLMDFWIKEPTEYLGLRCEMLSGIRIK